MSDFLREMGRSSYARYEAASAKTTMEELEKRVAALPPVRSLRASLAATASWRILAEVKRSSPSKGSLAPALDAVAQAAAYQQGGAAAISVLTEPSRFGGSLGDLTAVSAAVSLPVLRKDFLVHPWQVWEARAAGADAVLLIAELLPGDLLPTLFAQAHAAGLETLVETHHERELERVLRSSDVVGINARDLASLEMEPGIFAKLLPRIPADRFPVAESGLAGPSDLARAEAAGAAAFLVGEALVKSGDPAATLAAWRAAR